MENTHDISKIIDDCIKKAKTKIYRRLPKHIDDSTKHTLFSVLMKMTQEELVKTARYFSVRHYSNRSPIAARTNIIQDILFSHRSTILMKRHATELAGYYFQIIQSDQQIELNEDVLNSLTYKQLNVVAAANGVQVSTSKQEKIMLILKALGLIEEEESENDDDDITEFPLFIQDMLFNIQK